ncbi:SUR7 protein [Xylaria palmicola]|nr:SUR7 protein [Xylaria palmicola]
MGVGRYFCVALPFILTVASIIAALIAGLTGVTSNDLYVFRIDITNLSIDATQLQDIVNNVSSLVSGTKLEDLTNEVNDKIDNASDDVSSKIKEIINRSPVEWHDPSFLSSKEETDVTADVASGVADALSGTTIQASDLGLANIYDFTLWGYCVTPQEGKRNCTKAQFDWASHELDLDWLSRLTDVAGLNVTLPKELDDGLDLYKTITKWTEVVFIIAIVALGLELLVGLFSGCSRGVSCITWIISGFATTAVIAFAVLVTVTGSIVTGAVLGAGHEFGVKANVNTSYLAVAWISAAFAIGASLFWLFSVCCCKPENRPRIGRPRHVDSEKAGPTGAYAPIGENRISGYSGYNNYPGPQRGGARSDLAYEPYSHSRV